MEKRTLVTTSWDDGHVLDQRLADMLATYGIRGTFYIAPENSELKPDERLSCEGVRTLAQNFEIGAHTLTHRHLPTLFVDEARREIAGSKEVLEKMIGRPVTSFCYPAGKYTKVHPPLVREAGFTCARTVKRFAYTAGNDPYEMPTSVHTYKHWLDVWGVLQLADYNPFRFLRLYRAWDKQAVAMFDRVRREGGVFHLWGHSWEVEAHGDWERLEQVLQYIGGHADVQYVTNGEVNKMLDSRYQIADISYPMSTT